LQAAALKTCLTVAQKLEMHDRECRLLYQLGVERWDSDRSAAGP
jgi:hypothetical protein